MSEEGTQFSSAGLVLVIQVFSSLRFVEFIAECWVLGDGLKETIIGIEGIFLGEEFIELIFSKM